MNPFQEQGIPIEKQIMNWGELNGEPYDKNEVHPYTRTRIILMNGIEVEGALSSHHIARHTEDPDLKRKLALTRRIEQQQQKLVSGLIPGDESVIENTLGYEQVAVDLTAQLAMSEPDKNVKDALDFALLEDFDHLYRYSNLYESLEEKSAENIVGEYTEIFPGRPTVSEHRHPFETIRTPYDRNNASLITMLHVLTITAAEQQTMNFYMNVANRLTDKTGRGLYQEIGMIEEQHVSHYESLMDPNASRYERLVLQEYNECYMYYSCMVSEVDDRIKNIWRTRLEEEIEHLRIAAEIMKKYDKKDPTEIYNEFPEPTVFRSNKEYIRGIVGSQLDLAETETGYMDVSKLPGDAGYFMWNKAVNSDGFIPSEEVIKRNIDIYNRDFRIETEGPHPVERLRSREMVTH